MTLTTDTRNVRSHVIRAVGIESLLDRARRDPQRLAARCRLDRLEVQRVGRSRRDQRFDFGDDLGFEGRFEAPFFAASGEVARVS